MTRHELKCWPEFYEEILEGRKRHEVRRSDRPFAVGDLVDLREWDPATKAYTGRSAWVLVTYVTAPGSWGLPETTCVFSLEVQQCEGCRTALNLEEIIDPSHAWKVCSGCVLQAERHARSAAGELAARMGQDAGTMKPR